MIVKGILLMRRNVDKVPYFGKANIQIIYQYYVLFFHF